MLALIIILTSPCNSSSPPSPPRPLPEPLPLFSSSSALYS